MCIGVCCKNITFFDNIVCLFRHSHITSYSPAFQVISVISPPGLPGKKADRRIWRVKSIVRRFVFCRISIWSCLFMFVPLSSNEIHFSCNHA